MDYKKLKKDINSKEEFEAYIKTLPKEIREEVQQLMDNLEPRMMLATGIGELVMTIHDKYPSTKDDGLFVLASLIAVAGTSNMDKMILHCLQEGGVLETIKELLADKIKETDSEEGIKNILKDFKFNNN